MATRTTRKRARTSSAVAVGAQEDAEVVEDDVPKQPLVRDEEFWYDDGTIILIARNVEFRIYKGILAEHSPVFKDMFSFPQPPSAPNTEPQCPVVHLSDSPEDLRHVLRVYMPKNGINPFEAEHPSFDMISATVRLGLKYQISTLVEHSMKYLKGFFSSDLDTWGKQADYLPPGFSDPDVIGVINLARLTGETSILPTAVIAACMEWNDVHRGRGREDGTLEQLTMDDIALCNAAKDKLIQERVRIVLQVLAPPVSRTCKNTNPGDCKRAMNRALKDLAGKVDKFVVPDPFSHIDCMFQRGAELAVCDECWRMILKREDLEHRDLWQRLPTLLRLVKDAGQAQAAAHAT
ncbi:hypothetical protein FKP32DRAFT_1575116 [Trametes sanguinea]|nr:hypothetical protein FKP32DRAFT_1575116 [Trametes sanguinea]